jgi:hypothetical protein
MERGRPPEYQETTNLLVWLEHPFDGLASVCEKVYVYKQELNFKILNI